MNASQTISKIRRKWLLSFWFRNLTLLFFGTWTIFLLGLSPIWFELFYCVATGIVIYFLWKDWPTTAKILNLLNAKFPQLEFSANLLQGKELTGLARIQQKKVEEELRLLQASMSFPVQWKPVLFVCSALVVTQVVRWVTVEPDLVNPVISLEENVSLEAQPVLEPIQLEEMTIRVSPPDYTGLASLTIENDIRMPEGSRVSWDFNFSDVPKRAYLHFANEDSLNLIKNGSVESIQLVGLDQGFYWVQYFDGSQLQRTPYYKIEVVPDKPPEVSIEGIPQYQEIPFSTDARLSFKANMKDEYGLSEAYVVATVTKGEGESVKFREEKLVFEQAIEGKQLEEVMTFSAAQFDMEPGNELYFYLEAVDNKRPTGQINRTETYFFVLEDTTDVEFSLAGGLGVDLMPEYFRSQRQIIIDTEKLLAEREEISDSEFKARSNELGFDQKSLRLKYGQFLGEEAESGIAIESEIDAEDVEKLDAEQNPRRVRDQEDHDHKPGENVLEEFGHNHDHEDEAGQLMDKGTEQKTEAEKAIEEISHNHDDAETATFYEVSLKTKLKTALSEMWDAELYLRLYEPDKSLPYQYAALELLKEIKNHARIYVQRIGFDPPPITEDGKRLTGNLEEVRAQQFRESRVDSLDFPAIREALLVIGSYGYSQGVIPNRIGPLLQKAGNELAGEAIKFPSKYLSELSLISRLMDLKEFDERAIDELIALRGFFLGLVEKPESQPLSRTVSSHTLTDRVRRKLSTQSGSRP